MHAVRDAEAVDVEQGAPLSGILIFDSRRRRDVEIVD
jgi:hypothetical protein